VEQTGKTPAATSTQIREALKWDGVDPKEIDTILQMVGMNDVINQWDAAIRNAAKEKTSRQEEIPGLTTYALVEVAQPDGTSTFKQRDEATIDEHVKAADARAAEDAAVAATSKQEATTAKLVQTFLQQRGINTATALLDDIDTQTRAAIREELFNAKP
jgi:hypothetical protein